MSLTVNFNRKQSFLYVEEKGEKEDCEVNWKLLAQKALPLVLTIASIVVASGLYWCMGLCCGQPY